MFTRSFIRDEFYQSMKVFFLLGGKLWNFEYLLTYLKEIIVI